MHTQLPPELNFHIISFLSSNILIKLKHINKFSYQFIKDPFIWENFLEKDFFIKKIPGKSSERQYKDAFIQLKAEQQAMSKILYAYLYSFEIKQRILDHSIPDPMSQIYVTPLLPEVQANIQLGDNLRRLDKLDGALLRSYSVFDQEVKNMEVRYPQIDQVKLRIIATQLFIPDIELNSIEGIAKDYEEFKSTLSEIDKNILDTKLCSIPAKSDAFISMRILANQTNLNPGFLGCCLHTACSFLNNKTAQVLIELGANLDFLKGDMSNFGYFSETTPLFEVLQTIRIRRIYDPHSSVESAKALIQLLLNHGANPDARIFIQGEENDRPAPMPDPGTEDYENSKVSIRELCRMQSQSPGFLPSEILEMIITFEQEEKFSHKRIKLT